MPNKIIPIFLIPFSIAIGQQANSGAAGSFLNPTERASLLKRATAGDADAAFRLYEYYGFAVNDRKNSLKWLQFAADHGHVVDMYNYGLYLKEMKDDKKSAMPYIRGAAEKGHQEARELLKQLDNEK